MWNEQISEACQHKIEVLSKDNNEYMMSLLKNEFTDLIILDFTIFNYVDPEDTILLMISENLNVGMKILCENYHYGAVVCGINSENKPFTKVILANQKSK